MTVYHNHHIIPKHMDGSDDPSNIERITIEEHAERHKALYEQHGHEQDRIAWLALSGQITYAEATKLAQQMPKSEEWKQQASERWTGEGNPRYGQTWEHTDETKEKISEGLKIYVAAGRTPEHNAKIDFSGRIHTEASIQKIKKNRKGKGLWSGTDRIPPNTGKTQSDHQKKTVAAFNSRTWKITTPAGEVVIISNLNQFCRENGLDQSNLCRGTHKGYRATRT